MRLLDRLRRRPPPPGPLADLAAVAVPERRTPLREVALLAVDVETTGLKPGRDEVLSVGFVPVVAGEVLLGAARHLPVRPRGSVGQSAAVHGLTDDALADAPPMAQVLPDVLRAFTGQEHRLVMLAHFARIETGFLSAACRQLYGTDVPLPVIDTWDLELRLLRKHLDEVPTGRVRLDACRRARGLPRYSAHNAAVDALACAELFLAQWAELQARQETPLTLGDVLT